MAKTRFLVICLLLVHATTSAGADVNELTPLKVHVSDLTNICVAEVVPAFKRVLFQYAFASLNSEPNVEFNNYKAFVDTQLNAFNTAKQKFKDKVSEVKGTTKDFLTKWAIWFAYKHIDYFYSKKTGGGTFPKLAEAEELDKTGTLKSINFEMNSDTIEALFSHLTTDLTSEDELLLKEQEEQEKKKKDQTEKKKQEVKSILKKIMWDEYVNLLDYVYTKKFDQDTSEWAIEFMSVFIPFHEPKDLYRIFLRFPPDTVVYSEVGPAANFFAMDEVYMTRESNSPLSYVILFDSFYFTGSDLGFDYDMIAAFSGFTNSTHSAEFLTFLNSEGDNAVYHKAKAGLYYIYSYLSIRGAGEKYSFTNNASKKEVASKILQFMLEGTGTVCYKSLTAPTPDCTLEEILPIISFTKRYCHMIELAGSLMDVGAGKWAENNLEKIKSLQIWKNNVGMDLIKDKQVKGVCEAARSVQNSLKLLEEIMASVKQLITDKEKTINDAGFYSKKFYNVIINRRKIARTIVTTTIIERVLVNLRKVDKAESIITEFKTTLQMRSDEEVYLVVIYHLIMSVIGNIFGHIKKESKNGQDVPCEKSNDDITKFHCNEKDFAEGIIAFMATYAADTIGLGMKKASTDGLRNYLQTTLRLHGIPNRAYFTTVLANEYRPFDAYIFTFKNLAQNEQTAYNKLFTDQTFFPSGHTLLQLVETQPLIAVRMDSFEMFKNYVGLFKHYMWEQNIGTQLTVVSKPHDKTFLTLFNQVYKFLAQIRFLSPDIESDPIAEILTFCLNCLKARETQPRPLDQKETEPCVLSYAEQIEVTYLIMGFFLKKNGERFNNDLAATITEISKFVPAHLDNFLKLIYYEPIMAQMWSNYCEIGENHEADIFKKKPICISINIVAKTKNCAELPGINAATANAHQLHENAILWLTTCINHEINYLEGTKPTADITILSYTYAAFSALFHLDAHNGIFEVLLDEARIDGYIEIAKAGFPKDGVNIRTLLKTGGAADPDADAGLVKLAEDYQVYKKFERCIAIELTELEDDTKPIITTVKDDYAKFLRLRFQKASFTGEQAAFATELWKIYGENTAIAKIEGNVVVEFVEALLKYADTMDQFKLMAELLIRSGKALSVVHMSTRGRNIVEEGFFAQIENMATGEQVDARKFILNAWDTLQMTIIAKSIQTQEKIVDPELSELESKEFIQDTAEYHIHAMGEKRPNGHIVNLITPIINKEIEKVMIEVINGRKEETPNYSIENQMSSTGLLKTTIAELNSNLNSVGNLDQNIRTRLLGENNIIPPQDIIHAEETSDEKISQKREFDESEEIEEQEVFVTMTAKVRVLAGKGCNPITEKNWASCLDKSAPKEGLYENGMSQMSGHMKIREALMVLQEAGVKFGDLDTDDMLKATFLPQN